MQYTLANKAQLETVYRTPACKANIIKKILYERLFERRTCRAYNEICLSKMKLMKSG